VNHADLTIVFVQAHNVSALLSLSPKLPTLKIIVAIGEISAASKELLDVWSRQRKIQVINFAERESPFLTSFAVGTYPMSTVEEIGAKVPIEPPTVTPETIATICYTSVREILSHKPE
jgi:long-chain acyl-CoA synthetase